MAGNNGYNAIEFSWDDSCKDVECVATATCFIFVLCTKGDWFKEEKGIGFRGD